MLRMKASLFCEAMSFLKFRSGDQRAAVEIDGRSRHEATRHAGGDQPRDRTGAPEQITANDHDLLACKLHVPPSSFELSRLIARADAGLALAEPGQLPDAGTGRVDVGGNVDVDEIGLAGGNALVDRLANIAGAIDAHALDAAGTRHRREIRIVALAGPGIVEIGRKLAAAEIAALQSADRGIGV